jgi:hypothetical protein
MSLVAKWVQTAAAAAGFFAGFVWSVAGWAAGLGTAKEQLLREGIASGALVSVGYAALFGFCFWSCLSSPRMQGLRATVAPAAFTLSFALGFVGIHGALRLAGG